jgi:hypothetical protein
MQKVLTVQFAGPASESPLKNPPSDSKSRRKRSGAVEVNDRFMKVTDVLDDTRNIWLVSHKLDLAGLPPHVRIIDERAPQRSLTVAVSALLDKRLYRRLEATPPRRSLPEEGAENPLEISDAHTSDPQDFEDSTPRGPVARARR